MFGAGPLEILVLGLLAFMLFGEKLPELARDAARFLHQMRTMADGATKGLRDELGPEFSDLELKDLHPRTLIQKHVVDAVMTDEESPMRTPVARPSTPSMVKPPAPPAGAAGPMTSYDTDAT